jgi:hypothetical protein
MPIDVQQIQKTQALQSIAQTLQMILNELRAMRAAQK